MAKGDIRVTYGSADLAAGTISETEVEITKQQQITKIQVELPSALSAGASFELELSDVSTGGSSFSGLNNYQTMARYKEVRPSTDNCPQELVKTIYVTPNYPVVSQKIYLRMKCSEAKSGVTYKIFGKELGGPAEDVNPYNVWRQNRGGYR